MLRPALDTPCGQLGVWSIDLKNEDMLCERTRPLKGEVSLYIPWPDYDGIFLPGGLSGGVSGPESLSGGDVGRLLPEGLVVLAIEEHSKSCALTLKSQRDTTK